MEMLKTNYKQNYFLAVALLSNTQSRFLFWGWTQQMVRPCPNLKMGLIWGNYSFATQSKTHPYHTQEEEEKKEREEGANQSPNLPMQI